jgi:hypothetical protein
MNNIASKAKEIAAIGHPRLEFESASGILSREEVERRIIALAKECFDAGAVKGRMEAIQEFSLVNGEMSEAMAKLFEEINKHDSGEKWK